MKLISEYTQHNTEPFEMHK